MHVALNLVEFNPGKMGGIETYVRNLLRLLPNGNRCELTVLCNEMQVEYFLELVPRHQLMVVANGNTSLHRMTRSALRKVVGVDLLARRISRLPVDVVHNPLTNVRPLSLRKPSVLTFYDMQHEYLPELFSSRELARRTRKYRLAVERATMIVAISEHAKQCLEERYGIDPVKIVVAHLGHGQQFRPVPCGDPQRDVLRNKYGLDRPYLYYPAAMWPHKNHGCLLAAVALMRERYQFAGKLVLTGISVHGQAEVMDEISRLGLDGVVRVLGHVPFDELPCLYSMAEMMVFPSLFEGFGIPLVEAMACGCPVICSDHTSIPEVVGNAAHVVTPLVPGELADAIWSLWNSPHEQECMRRRGLLRARQFSWERMVETTRAVYLRAAELHAAAKVRRS